MLLFDVSSTLLDKLEKSVNKLYQLDKSEDPRRINEAYLKRVRGIGPSRE